MAYARTTKWEAAISATGKESQNGKPGRNAI
jgi:hypothetical protein